MRRLVGDPMFWPPPDQSWAKSVRWSCGRPGYRPVFQFDEAQVWDAFRRAEYARLVFGMTVTRPDPYIVVTSVT